MAIGPDKREIKIYVDRKLIDDVDSVAKSVGVSRSKMIGNILDAGVSDVKLLQKIGVLKAVRLARDIKEKRERRVSEVLN